MTPGRGPGRRTVLRAAALGTLAPLLGTACAESAQDKPKLWHDGRLFIATGNTTGVYYQFGGGFADLISKHLPGYEARAEATGASGENIQRVASGDMDLGFTLADTAADAVLGRNAFKDKPQNVQALARIYRNYTHVVARAAAGIRTIADLKGKRVSTGSPNSGTDVLAGRLLAAAGLDPEAGIKRERLSLPETTKGIKAGTLDALFFSGGLPVPGMADLFAGSPGQFVLVPSVDVLPRLTGDYGAAYGEGAIGKGVYNTPDDVNTVVVANLIMVNPQMPADLAYRLTEVLFTHQQDLATVHPEAANFDRTSGAGTNPVPLHPGCQRFYAGG